MKVELSHVQTNSSDEKLHQRGLLVGVVSQRGIELLLQDADPIRNQPLRPRAYFSLRVDEHRPGIVRCVPVSRQNEELKLSTGCIG